MPLLAMKRTLVQVIIFIGIATFFLVMNPQGLGTDYGSGGGKYADRVDAFSEHVIRNTIIHNTLDTSQFSALPVITSGYPSGDYQYYSEGIRSYSSNLGAQAIPVSIVSRLLGLNSEQHLGVLFASLRLASAVALAATAVLFLLAFCSWHRIRTVFPIPFLVGGSAGLVYFANNLYWLPSLMLLPAAGIALQSTLKGRYSQALVFVLVTLNFLRGYEFATVLAIITVVAAMIFTKGGWRTTLRAGLLTFLSVVGAFIASISAHALVIVAEGYSPSLPMAVRTILSRAHYQTRILSAEGVPSPFSPEFVTTINARWEAPAFLFSARGPSLSEMAIIFSLLAALAFRTRKLSKTEALLFIGGFGGYVSWYVAGYQHIMWHYTYDWYIFSVTIGLSFCCLVLLYLDKAVRGVKRSFGGQPLVAAGLRSTN